MAFYVAKSYQGLEQVCEPYQIGNRGYIKVRLKNGTIKQVRTYTENEYRKLYPEEKVVDKYQKTQKQLLGFDLGYITIFSGDGMNEDNEWFKYSQARYARNWGWYFCSTDTIPEDIPTNCTAVRLPWTAVSDNDSTLNSEDRVIAAVQKYLYPDQKGQFAGEVGDKIDKILLVTGNYSSESLYGISHMILMEDNQSNKYLWNTTAQDWSVGTTHHVRGTIKELKVYRGECETILTRCREVQ